ncbi:MAG: cation:proton antiporter [Myxococcota bacterium]
MHDHDAQLVLTTIAVALAAGVFLIVAAKRLGIPAIVLLLAGGIALGPSGANIVQPAMLGSGLKVIVSLLVGVILFEGGLTLEIDGYRKAPRVIGRMLTIGVIVTWLGTALAIWLVTGFSPSFSLITASLVIVTGPTVIGPLLKRIRVNERLHHILHWEGVLIDPIGVFVAILCFEALALERGSLALVDLLLRIGAVLAIGLVGGQVLTIALRRRWIPNDMMGVVTLAAAVALFGTAETFANEAGLLAVTTAGLLLGIQHPVDLKPIRHFKAEITEMSIGILFILLSANLQVEQFVSFGLKGALVVALVMLAVRPLAILLSTAGTDLALNERLFLSWVAPRGIVAASMASLFSIEFVQLGVPAPRFVETFTFGVIIATIVVQATTAGWVARRLGLERSKPKGWLIISAHGFARGIAQFLKKRGLPSLLIDVNRRHIRKARRADLTAASFDAFDVEAVERHPAMAGVGYVLAITGNEELNAMLCRAWAPSMGADRCYRWHTNLRDSDTDDPRAGVTVWPEIVSPVLIGKELERGAARLLPTAGAARAGHLVHRLFTIDDGGVARPDVEARADDHPEALEGETLCLEREASFFLRSLAAELILESESVAPAELLPPMLDLVQKRVLPKLPVAAALKEILEREEADPAAIGKGIAVPHLFVDDLEEQVCVLVRLSDEADWFGHPVRLVLLLLSPRGDNERHLAVLADMVRLLGTDSLRAELLDAEIDQVIALLRRGPRD